MQIKIPATASDASRLYRCVVSNPLGTVVSDAVTVTLADAPPVIMKQPVNAVGAENEWISFSVAGNGAETYLWYYSVDGGATWDVFTPGSGYDTNTLRMRSIAYTRARIYKCALTNRNGTTFSDEVRITLA